MACYHPLPAYQSASSGQVVFSELKKHGRDLRPIEVPCGQCIGCRLERSRQWAIRCLHEASLYDENAFITLTYDDENIPVRGHLDYPEFQRFLKRLRKKVGSGLRFFMCGEYGENTSRPHYHALLFGFNFPDRRKLRELDSGCQVYRSAMLEELWSFGMSSIGEVTFESAAYCARYCVKKVTGPASYQHYARCDEYGEYQLTPEFAHMSLKPGIGQPWLQKFHKDVYPSDEIVVRGKKMKPPRYYDKKFAEAEEELIDWLKFDRSIEADARAEDNTLERLAVKEQVTRARVSMFRRNENEIAGVRNP